MNHLLCQTSRRLPVARASLLLTAVLAAAPVVGCAGLPGTYAQQGVVLGGVGGAVLGAAATGYDEDPALNMLIGGAAGAGGGYLVGSALQRQEREAVRRASYRDDGYRDHHRQPRRDPYGYDPSCDW